MTPATPWTELVGVQTPYLTWVPSALFTGLMLMDVPFPLVDAPVFIDPTVPYTEMSLSVATPQTEMTVASTPWTKVSL